MATAPKRAKGRSLKDFPNLTAAEKKLLKACREGEVARFGNVRPEQGTTENTIRPSLIRFLLLGGDDQNPVHEKGVQIVGAWIEHNTGSDIDLQGVHSALTLILAYCCIPGQIILRQASLSQVTLDGSSYRGLRGDRLICNRNLFLKHTVCWGETRLLGAEIYGSLECAGGQFINAGGEALTCDGAKIKGGLFMNDGFIAVGETAMLGAEISSEVACMGGSFENEFGCALNFSGTKIWGTLFLSNMARVKGRLNFSGANCKMLVDDFLQVEGDIILDGLTYEGFNGERIPTGHKRIAWLNKQPQDHLGASFRPQPWEQVIKVFREMGHESYAREVAIAKQNQMRSANKVGDFPLRQFHWLYGLLAGYGYEPLRAVFAMMQVFLLCALFYQIADSYGIMGPSSPIIHNSSIAETCGKPVGNLEATWTACADMPKEYTTFSAFWYSADLILPLVNLQQDTDWSPMVTRSALEYDGTSDYIALGVATRLLMWFEILFGWAASLLLVAVLGNLVKKD